MGEAYLVARGVRALAIIGTCPDSPESVQKTYDRLQRLGDDPAIPFVVSDSSGWVAFGFAAHAWVLDLLTFSDSCPSTQRDRILGLLLGYSSEAIRSFEERHSGRPIWSRRPSADD